MAGNNLQAHDTTVKKLCEKGPDGRFSPATWFHEGDFDDFRSESATAENLVGVTHEAMVTTSDGMRRHAIIDEEGHALIEMPRGVVEGD